MHGVSDAGTRLLFKFRSGTHGLNEGLGRHRGREGKLECTLCGAECRVSFAEKLEELLGDSYADFDLLSNLRKRPMC